MTSTFTIAVQHPKHNNVTLTYRIDVPSFVLPMDFQKDLESIYSQPFTGAPENDPTAWWDETERRTQELAQKYNAEIEHVEDPWPVTVAY